jgi:predicted RNA binding protein YcfA (HicA-like mRNA interferase family)
MPLFGPIKRSDLIKYLRKCGFDGPYSGGKHPFMIKRNLTLTVPNPHQKDIGREFLAGYSVKPGYPRKTGKNSSPTLPSADAKPARLISTFGAGRT